MRDKISFGWGAPKIGEQFPEMNKDKADLFDRFSDAIILLKVNGLINKTSRNSAYLKLSKMISKEVGDA